MYKMSELNKIGNIDSVNDFFDFKLSIKTIIYIIIAWVFICSAVFVYIMGGVNNSLTYLNLMMSKSKDTIIQFKTDVKSKQAHRANPVIPNKTDEDKEDKYD